MSSISVRFNSFLFFYSIFNEHKLARWASSEEWRVKSEEWLLKTALRFSSFSFIFYLLSLLSPNFVWRWSVWMDSNHRPRAYQARALTTWATNRYSCVDSSHLSARVCSLLLFLFIFALWKVKSEKWRVKRCVQTSLNAGGDDGIRTHDPLLAGQVLSQLSYTPIPRALFFFQGSFRSLKIEQQKICTQLSVYRPRRLVWQDRDILSRSP